MSAHPLVRIRYHRPPNRLQVFEQHLVHDGDDAKVTLAHRVMDLPLMRIEGDVVLEPGSSVVWFTFGAQKAGHTLVGFTGIYANVLTPPVMHGTEWETTDLFLDVWMPVLGGAQLLDEDELDEALGREWIDGETAARAALEAQTMMKGATDGSWPPAVVSEWTLARCRRELGLDS